MEDNLEDNLEKEVRGLIEIVEAVEQLASISYKYYQSMIETGFSEDQAMCLLLDFQRTLLTRFGG